MVGAETIMMKNGLYSLAAVAIDGVDVEVGGVLILQDGRLLGGDPYVYYTGTCECSDGKWKGDMTSQEHTPTTRPMVERGVADQKQAVFTLGKAGSPLETVDELCKKRDRMAYPRIRDSEGL